MRDVKFVHTFFCLHEVEVSFQDGLPETFAGTRSRKGTPEYVLNGKFQRKNMSPRVWCALVAAQLGFGAYGVIVTVFAKDSKADPLVFCLLRDAGAFPVMLIAAFFVEGKVSLPSLR